MRVDVFRREERDKTFSYLIVPEGRLIPSEAANIDWQLDSRGVELNLDTESLDELSIIQPAKQIQEKGYAISSSATVPGVDGHL
ncbi:DUF6139 family protein [Oxalobacter sp. OttesenSCG-928-P03]|nr:DUF6139 family protein [Oxalobacter sp. OttesenSCG-928-P03]